MKLTKQTMPKRVRAEVEEIRRHVQRAADYIRNPRMALAVRCEQATTTLHYARTDGAVLYEVSKEAGSDIAGLSFALGYLDRLIAVDDVARACKRDPALDFGDELEKRQHNDLMARAERNLRIEGVTR